MNFDQAFDRLIGNEGGYSNHPSDPGAETMWGITARVARANGYTGDMKALPRDTAKAIYRSKYWASVKAESLPDALRFDVFDAAVNSGYPQAVKWLQQSIGITADGVMGPITLTAVTAGNPLRVLMRFNGYRLRFMASLPTWPVFGEGWANRIADNLIESAK
jgi:lysozyme family protein